MRIIKAIPFKLLISFVAFVCVSGVSCVFLLCRKPRKHVKKQREAKTTVCPNCSYSANPDFVVCPRCGKILSEV